MSIGSPTPDQAYQAGQFARQAGRGREACPRYGITPDARALRVQWQAGWDAEDRDRSRATKRPKP